MRWCFRRPHNPWQPKELKMAIWSLAMEHKHKTFHLELSELRTKVSAMGELVVEQLERALVCLKEHNVGDARTITERDVNVNRMDIDVEEMCLQLLALH